MEVTYKKLKLGERRTMIKEMEVALGEKKVKIAAIVEDAKMLTLNADSLDADARMIVQSARSAERSIGGAGKCGWRRQTRRVAMRRRRHLNRGVDDWDCRSGRA